MVPPVTKNPDDDQAGGTIYSYGDKDAGCKFTNNELFDILRSISRGLNAGYKMNTRQQKYFEMGVAKDTKNPRDGFLDGNQFTKNQGQLLDPWGWQYCVVLDADDDGVIGMGNFYTDLSGAQNVIRVSAAAFSMGKDGKRGGSGYENRLRKPSSNEAPDDIFSW